MRYTTFRNLALATGAVSLGGLGYMCGHSQPQEARPLPPAAAPAPQSSANPTPPPAPVPAAAPKSEYEQFLLGVLGRPARGDKIKDGVGGRVKVNVYAVHGVWMRAKVDLDRDNKWDEKWWVDGQSIMREVAPADDERYGEKQVMGSTAGN